MKNIKQYVKDFRTAVKEDIKTFRRPPTLGIVQVGDNPVSTKYVNNKIKDCAEVGIKTILKKIDEGISPNRFISEVKGFVGCVDYIIVQKPLPTQLEDVFQENLNDLIPKEKDIDGFRDDSIFYPCTPFGIITYLEDSEVSLDGKKCVVIGRSSLVGRPMARMLINKNATVTLCHSHTSLDSLYDYCKSADIIVCAVGKGRFFDCNKVNPNAIIIDVGINFDENGKLCGDCVNGFDTQQITPVPGGVGLLTRKALIEQIYNNWKTRIDVG